MALRNNKIRVLVVGGAGYIGGAVTDTLLARKIPFTVYDNLTYEHQYLKPVDFIYGDIRDYKKLKSVLPKYTHVIWLAAIVGDPACQIDEDLTKEVNLESVKWLAKNYKGRIIFASTCSVYGRNDFMLDESADINPLSLYAKTKLDAEPYLLEHPDALVFRIGTAYGLSDQFSRVRLDLAVNLLTFRAIHQGRLVYFGGIQWRPYIHVKDIATAFVNGLDNKAKGTYNLAVKNHQIKDVAKRISFFTKCKMQEVSVPFQDLRNYHVDIEKVKKAGLLKGVKYDLDDGIKEMIVLASTKKVSPEMSDVHFNDKYLVNCLSNNKKLWKK